MSSESKFDEVKCMSKELTPKFSDDGLGNNGLSDKLVPKFENSSALKLEEPSI